MEIKRSNVIKLAKRSLVTNTHTNIVDDNIKEISAWKYDKRNNLKLYLLYFLSFGLIWILFNIYRKVYLKWMCVICDPQSAEYILILEKKEYFTVDCCKEKFFLDYTRESEEKRPPKALKRTLNKEDLKNSLYTGEEFNNSEEETVVFYFKRNKYIYIEATETFKACRFDLSRFTNEQIKSKFRKGIGQKREYDYLLNKYGPNYMQIKNKTLIRIIFTQFLNPFFFYQIFSIVIWLVQNYVSFSLVLIVCNILIIIAKSVYTYQKYFNILGLNRPIHSLVVRQFVLLPGDDSKEDELEAIRDKESNNINLQQVSQESQEEDAIGGVRNDSHFVVPGDILLIRSGEVVPCDCVILDGVCTVDESDLNGDSNLTMKVNLPSNSNAFSYEDNKKSFLFFGTAINKCESSTNEGCLTVLVLNTGFNTLRGNLIQNMFFIDENRFLFPVDLKLLFSMAFGLWLVACGISLYIYFYLNGLITLRSLVINLFDLVTVIIPPNMQISISFISFYFLFRMNYKQVACTDDQRVNSAGQVNVVVFDKTGTLTEEGIEIFGFQTTKLNKYVQIIEFDSLEKESAIYTDIHIEFWRRFCQNPGHALFKNYQKSLQNNLIYFLECLATCHSVDKLKDDTIGNSLDQMILNSLNWTQERCKDNSQSYIYSMSPKNSYKITEECSFRNDNLWLNKSYKLLILKRYDFHSKFSSMSVIVKNNIDESFRFFIKGAPEKIIHMCKESSIPKRFNEQMVEHTKNGLRVLACATKVLKTKNGNVELNDDRSIYENDLTFLGFIIFKNKLKKDTKKVISEIKTTTDKVIMATGDNIFTALSVARDIEMFEMEKEIMLIQKDDDDVNTIKFSRLTVDMSIVSDKHVPTEPKVQTVKAQEKKKTKSVYFNESIISQLSSDRKLLSLDNPTFSSFLQKLQKFSERIIDSIHIDLTKLPPDFSLNLDESSNYIAISGAAFNMLKAKLNEHETKFFARNLLASVQSIGRIFYRMTPNDKINLIKFLKEKKGNIVAMCGDGANDCGAILTSDVGISLRNKGNHLVTSHFYYSGESISCVELLIRNGRACYENSVITLKTMIVYAVNQLCTVLILFSLNRQFEPSLWLFIDGYTILLTCLLASITRASYKINSSTDVRENKKTYIFRSLLGQIFIQVSMQVSFFYMFKVYRYQLVINRPYYFDNYLGVIFSFNCFSYNRKKFYTNMAYLFYIAMIFFFVMCNLTNSFMFAPYVSLDRSPKILTFYSEVTKMTTLFAVCVNLALTYLFERYVNSDKCLNKHSKKE